MHGLINRALQSFACNTYGQDRWQRAVEAAGFASAEFEAMLVYDDGQSLRLLDRLCADVGRDPAELLEDLGTYLVSHPQTESLRRLLRFGGVSYVDFLHSLDDLPDRVRMAVSDLHLPALDLLDQGDGTFLLSCGPGLPGYGSVMTGVLRAMADDYGALVMLDHDPVGQGGGTIAITLVESAFAEGRSFDLGARGG